MPSSPACCHPGVLVPTRHASLCIFSCSVSGQNPVPCTCILLHLAGWDLLVASHRALWGELPQDVQHQGRRHQLAGAVVDDVQQRVVQHVQLCIPLQSHPAMLQWTCDSNPLSDSWLPCCGRAGVVPPLAGVVPPLAICVQNVLRGACMMPTARTSSKPDEARSRYM